MFWLPLPILFNIFLDRIMWGIGCVSIGERLITSFRFAEDIVVNAEEEEAGVLFGRLDTIITRYKMEIGEWKVMTNNPNGFKREIKIKRSEARSSELQVPWSNHL